MRPAVAFRVGLGNGHLLLQASPEAPVLIDETDKSDVCQRLAAAILDSNSHSAQPLPDLFPRETQARDSFTMVQDKVGRLYEYMGII